MQTFLPYPDFKKSASCLDYKRLGKQRVEGLQILNAIQGETTLKGKTYKGWINHPATIMWKQFPQALMLYTNTMINEWEERGYNNSMKRYKIPLRIKMPLWLGNTELHASHRSNLLRKDKLFYAQYGWNESEHLPYVWPV